MEGAVLLNFMAGRQRPVATGRTAINQAVAEVERRLKTEALQEWNGGYNPSRCQIVVVSPAWFMV